MSNKKVNRRLNKKSKVLPVQKGESPQKSKPYKKYFSYISYFFNAFLILLTLYSYYPSIIIQPLPFYFDGRDNWHLLDLKSSTFISLRDVQVFVKYNVLVIETSKGSIRMAGSSDALLPISSVNNNPGRTVAIRGIGSSNSGSIKAVRESNILISVTYKLPLLPITFGKSIYFFATKNDEYSIKWFPM